MKRTPTRSHLKMNEVECTSKSVTWFQCEVIQVHVTRVRQYSQAVVPRIYYKDHLTCLKSISTKESVHVCNTLSSHCLVGHLPLLQPRSDPCYYFVQCMPYVLCEYYLGSVQAVLRNANTTVRFACFTYTAHSVVVYITYTTHSVFVCIAYRSRVQGATSSPKSNFHNDSPGSGCRTTVCRRH